MKKMIPFALTTLALTLALSACGSSPSTAKPSSYIGLDAAKETALQDAQLSDATFTTAELEDHDGTAYYELDFTDGDTEYRYAVDAVTGTVIESSSEAVSTDEAAPTTDSAVDEAKATEIALKDAGVAEADTSYLKAKLDTDDGIQVYDVEFYADGTEYDYEIEVATGKIRSKDSDAEGYTPTQTTATGSSQTTAASTSETGTVDESKAKSIALKDAGVSESDTSYLKVKPDYDDGVQVYEVEFYAGGTEYDYEIEAATGKIRSKDYDAEGYTPEQTGSAKTESEIQAIALAKVPGATAEHIRLKQDYDDGRALYEGQIIYDGMEYEFEIDAYSGAILEWDAESVYD